MENIKTKPPRRNSFSARTQSQTRLQAATSSTNRKSAAPSSSASPKPDSKLITPSSSNSGQIYSDFVAIKSRTSFKSSPPNLRASKSGENFPGTAKATLSQKSNKEPRRYLERASSAVTRKPTTYSSCSDEHTNCIKPPIVKTSKDIIQRLTNGGIAKVSLKSKRRHSFDSTDWYDSTKTQPEKTEPKSILKNAPIYRKLSIDCSVLYRYSQIESHRMSSPKSHLSSDNDISLNLLTSTENNNEMSSGTQFESTQNDKDILKRCQYRLAVGPVTTCETGPKKVTFKNDLAFISGR